MVTVDAENLMPDADRFSEDHEVVDVLTRRNRNLLRVNEVSQHLTSMLDEAQVMRYLLTASAEIIGAPIASLWMWDDEQRETLSCRATHPIEEKEALRNLRLKKGEGVAGWVITNRASAVTDNPYEDERFTSEFDKKTGFNTQSMLAVPLIIRDEVIGVVEILNKTREDFDSEDLAMVETLAAAAAIALENARLVMSLREKTDQLQVQNSELDAFAHTVAHDLKGPLSSIIGFADLLNIDVADMNAAEIKQATGAIAKSAYKMNDIIQEILLLSGVRRINVDYQPIDMNHVVGESLLRMDHLIREAGATVKAPSEWPIVLGHAPWVEEVWANYLSNAIKYGGRPPEIELGFDIEDEMAWFWVQDNGTGLTQAQQDTLFVPFTRLEQVDARGHGLGLSIVQRIVTKLKGTVAIDSEVDNGSRFKFSLPLTAE